jgi:hypothetical protein
VSAWELLDAEELLAALHARGAEVKADGDRLVFRAPLGLSGDLKAEVSARRTELLALLRPPAPPTGARLFFQAANARICWPDDAALHHWCYEHAPRWYYAKEHSAPPCEPVLAAHCRRRCPGCSGRKLRVAWVQVKNGKRQLRCRCLECGASQGCLKQEPANPELEWRAT